MDEPPVERVPGHALIDDVSVDHVVGRWHVDTGAGEKGQASSLISRSERGPVLESR